MMRKTLALITLLFVFALPFTANAEVLLWMVNSSPVRGATNFGGGTQDIVWDHAVLRATTADSANAAIYGGTGGITESATPNYGTTVTPTTDTLSSGGVALQNYVGEYSGIYEVGFDNFNSEVAADITSLAALGLDEQQLKFYVELYDSSDVLVGYSSALSYTALSEFRNEARYFADWSTYSSWNPSDWTAVPEPTSGMLALLGLIALGLRRRRA